MPHPLYAKREFLTISELDTAARCMRKYFYQCGCGLRLPASETGQSAMYFGTCIHKAIGRWWTTWDLNETFQCFDESWAGTVSDDKRNNQTARMMLINFATMHPKGGGLYTPLPPPSTSIKLDEQERISDWEIPFAIDIGLPLPLLGRIDGWCRMNHSGQVKINEYKTTSEMSNRFKAGFRASPQVVGYTLAIKTQGVHKVEGCIVEALKVAKTSWETCPLPIDVPDFELERFVKWAQFWGGRILHCEATEDWMIERSGCTTYPSYGQPGYMCDYEPLCSVPDWDVLKGMYRQERHVPFVMATVNGQEIPR